MGLHVSSGMTSAKPTWCHCENKHLAERTLRKTHVHTGVLIYEISLSVDDIEEMAHYETMDETRLEPYPLCRDRL